MARLTIWSLTPGEGKSAVAGALAHLLGAAYVSEGAVTPLPPALVPSTVGDPVVEAATADPGGRNLLVLAYRGAETANAAAEVSGFVLLNAVPSTQAAYVTRQIAPALGERLVGIVPEERPLRGAPLRDLAAHLDAEVLTASDRLDELFASVMVGAMSHAGSSGLPYFGRRDDKIVVTGGDRIDIHLAALGTPCRAIVATGGYDPDPVVHERAEAEGVPILKVAKETEPIVEEIGRFLRGVRFAQPSKLETMVGLLREHVALGVLDVRA